MILNWLKSQNNVETNLFYFVFRSSQFSNFYVFAFFKLFLDEPAMVLQYSF